MRRLPTAAIAGLLLGVAACNGGGDDGNAGPDGPHYVDGTYSVTWGPYLARAGEENTKCVELLLHNPGPIHVHEIHNTLGQTSHHFIVYRKAGSVETPAPVDCVPFVGTLNPANGAPLMVTQKSDETLTLPDGVSFTLGENQLVRLELHYVNTTDADVMVSATTELRTQLESTYDADFLFAGTPDINLPSQPTTQTVGPVYLPYPQMLVGKNVFAITGHTHHLGTNVQVATATGATDPGTMVYSPTNFSWKEPETSKKNPPLMIPDTGGFRFSCDYLNTTGQTVRFGESASDEMCFFWLYYYPSAGAKVCFHTDQQGGHNVCCPAADNDGESALICGLIQQYL